MEGNLSFKPINVSNALEILQRDLSFNQMSPEIIKDLGEIFIKHMYMKEYEADKGGSGNISEVDEEVSQVNASLNVFSIDSETKNIAVDEEKINQNTMINQMTEQQLEFNEELEKRKLMKYLTLGWYIHTYCLTE